MLFLMATWRFINGSIRCMCVGLITNCRDASICWLAFKGLLMFNGDIGTNPKLWGRRSKVKILQHYYNSMHTEYFWYVITGMLLCWSIMYFPVTPLYWAVYVIWMSSFYIFIYRFKTVHTVWCFEGWGGSRVVVALDNSPNWLLARKTNNNTTWGKAPTF